MKPKYPSVTIRLSGRDGNAFMMTSRTRTALRRSGVSEQECEEFFDEALSGDYDHVIQTIMKWVKVS